MTGEGLAWRNSRTVVGLTLMRVIPNFVVTQLEGGTGSFKGGQITEIPHVADSGFEGGGSLAFGLSFAVRTEVLALF